MTHTHTHSLYQHELLKNYDLDPEQVKDIGLFRNRDVASDDPWNRSCAKRRKRVVTKILVLCAPHQKRIRLHKQRCGLVRKRENSDN
jgi:hypothetical protein